MTWDVWKAWRQSRRDALAKYGCDTPSRRTRSYDASERFMRAAFGGRRIPAWAESQEMTK